MSFDIYDLFGYSTRDHWAMPWEIIKNGESIGYHYVSASKLQEFVKRKTLPPIYENAPIKSLTSDRKIII